ncbi:hypothetical protein CDAR_489811 [Caerostris darwini]|uniref:Uncharacterized protein n=1 Tax=Caerostris darwini TaxID=1538125 RepID=A0AAV4SQ02_9ARAC|nr:hypothetical protein CDAR_489811 [Caerostris darwini]
MSKLFGEKEVFGFPSKQCVWKSAIQQSLLEGVIPIFPPSFISTAVTRHRGALWGILGNIKSSTKSTMSVINDDSILCIGKRNTTRRLSMVHATNIY